MSDLAMTCPECGSHTSSIGQASRDGEPCPYCGTELPAPKVCPCCGQELPQ